MKFWIKTGLLLGLLLAARQASAVIAITQVNHNDSPFPGDCTGEIHLTAEGTAGPFTIQWSTGSTGLVLYGLCAGVYTVTVTNVFGCSKVLEATIHDCQEYIGQPLSITQSNLTQLSSPTASNGAIDLIVNSSGHGPKYFKWTKQGSNTVIATTEDLDNLSAGTYCVDITGDCFGGTGACYLITDCNTLSWTVTPTIKNDCDCSGCSFCANTCQDGAISLNVPEPAGPKTYRWNTGATTSGISGLSDGNYTVTITHSASGCTAACFAGHNTRNWRVSFAGVG